jgi:hypothetical protein
MFSSPTLSPFHKMHFVAVIAGLATLGEWTRLA